MFDKYFGFLKSHDEETILNTLIEHAKIDSEELYILSEMIQCVIKESSKDVSNQHQRICKIDTDNSKIFETLTDHIIQSNFDHQKQYDLLRLQQRIQEISSLIIATSQTVVLLTNIKTTIPNELHHLLKSLVGLVVESHKTFIQAIQKYQESRKSVIQLIHQAEEEEVMVDNKRIECLEVLYSLANNEQLKLGDFKVIERMIEYLEDISDAIKSATTSLDWLLLG